MEESWGRSCELKEGRVNYESEKEERASEDMIEKSFSEEAKMEK